LWKIVLKKRQVVPVIQSLPLGDFTEFAHIDGESHPELWALFGGFLCHAPVFKTQRTKHGLFKDPMSAPKDLRDWTEEGEINVIA
jgi:hypothetical protein